MLAIEGEEKKPQLWVGTSLRHFGTNPYNEPFFRVVWAPSITMMIGGKHTLRDGEMLNDRELAANQGRDYSVIREWVGYKRYPRYPGKNNYVLERWLDAVSFGGTPATWEMQQRDAETNLLTLGPYPSRGEYEACWHFTSGYPTISAVESIIRMVLAGQNYSLAEKKAAMVASDERDRLDRRNRNADLIMDSLPAHGFAANSRFPGKKKAEDYKLRYAANELGLPVGEHKVFTKRG